ncbi:DUF1684 domain-containing protein [Blastococcus sp. Marseille-P5729]|uniref:DUF1684 domain-containing protein n=1 Tax=Blastococcus sp. Marseille-P5729 TaxID=2086582 RepID=UPI000D0F31AB|nr:DUF1684 domain-containing protein [Blastococcus sp. Marseille-P5729]
MTTTSSATETFADEWRQWHAEHEKNRADGHGFLAITGLYWLSAEPTTLPDAPGTWITGENGPVVELGESESLTVGGERVTGRHEFGPIPERGGVNAEFDGGVIEVARRGGRDLLRPRRPDNAFLKEYQGNPAFSPDPAWRVDARFVPWDEPRAVTVGAAVDDLQHVYDSPGQVEFEIDGETHRLTTFPGHEPGSLFVLFTDQTSGITTYGANRSIAIAAPDAAGHTVLDFNRAVNLPCAHTDFATCPLPPAENRLPIAVEAGEKTPKSRLVGKVTDTGITL